MPFGIDAGERALQQSAEGPSECDSCLVDGFPPDTEGTPAEGQRSAREWQHNFAYVQVVVETAVVSEQGTPVDVGDIILDCHAFAHLSGGHSG